MEYVYRYNIKPGKAGEFIAWTKKMEESPPEAPEGWSYGGTYFTVRGFGKFDAEARWILDDYAALGAGFGGEAFQEMNREFFDEFYDDRFPGETQLLKSSGDVQAPPGF